MSTIFPQLTPEELGRLDSRGEAKVYDAFRRSSAPDHLVLHSVKWIVKKPGGRARDGETDFLVCAGSKGLLVVEVKGGGIRCDPATGVWASVDAQGNSNPIRDPFEQALGAKYAIKSKLKEHPHWHEGLDAVPFGHAVFFPDLSNVAPLCRPAAPREIIGAHDDLNHIARWTEQALNYWASSSAPAGSGEQVARIVKEVFARPTEVVPLLSWRLAEEERIRIKLTERQARVLAALGGRRRAAIAGGAGTGKSLLALEKARKLASEGFYTLLTCYNRPLADFLARACQGLPNLQVMTFHQLCSAWAAEASKQSGRDLMKEAEAAYPGQNTYDVHFPFALATAVECLDKRFDAVVVDEGQDFREEYWLPIELILKDPDQSPLYIFYDQNQNLYHRAASFPIKDDPFVLTTNCRNTKVIHDAAYRYFRGDQTDPPEIPGAEIAVLNAPSTAAQAQRIQALITQWIAKEKVLGGDIAVLLLDTREREARYKQLTGAPLPKPAIWRVETHGDRNGVLLETANRFKGLEAAIIVLWGLDSLPPEQSRELLYVGMSRAKSLLVVCGTEGACQNVLGSSVG